MAGLVALALASWGSAVYALPFGDSDTLTRIAYLDSAGWKGILDPLYLRDGAPGGMLLEWTLPFNALALLQGQILGWPLASILSGPFGLLILMGSAWSASRQLGRAAPWAIACMLSSTSVSLAYAQPGRVSHHDVTAALCIACIATALRWWRRPGCLSGALAGAAGALALWQSMETVPMVLAGWSTCLVAAVFWPGRIARARIGSRSCLRLPNTCWYGIGAICVLVPALALDGPWPRFPLFTMHRLSLCHLAIMSAASLGLMIANALASSGNKRTFLSSAGMRGLMALGAGFIPLLVASGMLLLLKPDTVHGPLFDSYFWSPIGELGNLLTNPFTVLPALAIPAFTASTWSVFCCGRRPGRIMRWNLLAILCGCILMGCIYVRLIIYAESMSLVMGSIMLATWLRRWRLGNVWFALACALMHALAFMPVNGPAVAACRASPQWGQWLEAGLPEGATVLADIWPTPSILASTVRLRAVGGPYHGNPLGIEDVARFMTGNDEQAAQDILTRRNALAVVLCADPLYAPGAPWPDGSMARRLVSGSAPSWLVPMDGAPPGGLRAWRVVPPATR